MTTLTTAELTKLMNDNPQLGIDASATATDGEVAAEIKQMNKKAAEAALKMATDTIINDMCLRWHGPMPKSEYMFHPDRRWAFDYAWPDVKIAIEIQGGTWSKPPGKHLRAPGYSKDCKKLNAAVAMGWKVMWFPSDMVYDGSMAEGIEWVGLQAW